MLKIEKVESSDILKTPMDKIYEMDDKEKFIEKYVSAFCK